MAYGTYPSSNFAAVTPSDTIKLQFNSKIAACRGLYIGTAGNIAIKDKLGNSVTFSNLAAGIIYPLCTEQVMATNTTASNIVALF